MTNKELGNYLKDLRLKKNLSTRQVYEMCNVSNGYLSLVENRNRKASAIILKKLAAVYNVDYLTLYEKAGYIDLINEDMKQKSCRIPVLGRIPAGIPIELIQDIIDYEDISEDMLRGGKEYFALKVKGNSMWPKYLDGDTIIVLRQDNCESGEDCIVMVNGNDGTFKRVIKKDTGIILEPINQQEYDSISYSNEDIEKLPVRILGVVKELRRSI